MDAGNVGPETVHQGTRKADELTVSNRHVAVDGELLCSGGASSLEGNLNEGAPPFKAEPTPWWDGIVHCEVLELDLHKRLRYSWRSGPESSRLDTVVTWSLTPTPSGGTRLALEHSGFLPANAFAFDGASKGWQRMAGERLREVLARAA